MTREVFKKLAMGIIAEQKIKIGELEVDLFDCDDIDSFKIAQYDDDDWAVEATMPFEDFLDELYMVILGM